MSAKKEFGDFQTPPLLAQRVVALVEELYGTPDIVIEPTAGLGSFLSASSERWKTHSDYEGYEINEEYVHLARKTLKQSGVRLLQRDFFSENWKHNLARSGKNRVLVIGNPPWVATRLAQSPGGTLPQAMPQWDELKAAYRFLTQPTNTPEQVLKPHWKRTQTACLEPGEYLLLEDTTQLDYTCHNTVEGLGIIGKGGRGLCLHSTLALKIVAWDLEQRPEAVLVGLFDQQCWAQQRRPEGETRAQRVWRTNRMSKRWAQVLKTSASPATGSTWTYVADRESDFYEPIQRCQQRGADFVIRACQDHRLAKGKGHLWDKLPEAKVLGKAEVELRTRPGAAARRAVVQLRSIRVSLSGPWRAGGKQADLEEMNVLEVKEMDLSAESEPLHWILLTSLSCSRLTEARRVVGRYAARWHIEEYHKALKSGTGVEESQLEQAYRLETLIAVLSLVALRLLNTKLLARACPDQMLETGQIGVEGLKILEKRFGQPEAGWTQGTFWVAVARLGGFIGRKNDGPPGWLNIWRGWQRLIWMSEGLESFNQLQKRCG